MHPPRRSDARSRDAGDAAWNEEQLGLFLTATQQRRDAWLWRLLGVVGLRRGEALELRWRDPNLEKGTLRVAWTRTSAGGEIVEGLRHTAATVAFRAGVPVHVVSRRLGHSVPSITLSIYAHVLGGDDQAAADLIAVAIPR